MNSLSSHAAMVEAKLKSAETRLAASQDRLARADGALVVAGEALAGQRPVVEATDDFYVLWAWARLAFWAANSAAAYWGAFWPPALVLPIGTGALHLAMVVGTYLRRADGSDQN